MIIDLTHNKILKDTVSEAFVYAVTEKLVPQLSARFGVRMLGLQMYEDYIKDDFSRGGFWYYPMTVILPDAYETVWVKWDISDKESFREGIPYSFVGESLDILIAQDTPEEFYAKLEGRSRYFKGGCVKLSIHTGAPNPTFLSGRYSQTFVDEMTRQLTEALSRAAGVSGLSESSIEFSMVFAPETYMEHTSENVTYRRLLISAKGCSPRDFWIKWKRTDSALAYSVNDNVTPETIVFELGEDVPHKVREKEYRFLVYGNSDKYRIAMGRKNITEWRELIKRLVKKGELTKTAVRSENDSDISQKDNLSDILEKCGITAKYPQSALNDAGDSELDAAMRIAREAAGISTESEKGEARVVFSDEPQENPSRIAINPDNPFAALFAQVSTQPLEAEAEDSDNGFPSSLGITLESEAEIEAETEAEIEAEVETEAEIEAEVETDAEIDIDIGTEPDREIDVEITLDEVADESELEIKLEQTEAETEAEAEKEAEPQPEKIESLPMATPFVKYESIYDDDDAPVQSNESGEAEVAEQASSCFDKERAEYEARIAELIKEKEELRKENERLAESAKAEITLRLAQEAKLREQLELEAKERAREKLLFAEAARAVREENEKLAKQAAAAAEKQAAEAAQIEQQRLRVEELRLANEEMERQVELIEAQMKARTEAAEDAAQRAEELRVRMEKEARKRAELMVATEGAAIRGTSSAEAQIIERDTPVSISEPQSSAPAQPKDAPTFWHCESLQKTVESAQPMQKTVATPAPVSNPQYTYIQKLARLRFCHKVDPNITTNIHKLMSEAIEKNEKSDVYMKVKASIPEEKQMA